MSTLKERREKINAWLQRKSSTIEDLLFSTRNLVAVEEELAQFNDLFKMLQGMHKEYNALLENEERTVDDDWFDDLEKGKGNRLSTLKERREKINAWLQRRSSAIEDLLFSTRNLVAVEEELAQFNDLFEMLQGMHKEYNTLLEDEERTVDDDWFDDLDNRVCAFKRKTHNQVNIAHEEQQSSRHSSKGAAFI